MPAATIVPIAAGLIGAGTSAAAGAAGVGKNSFRAGTFEGQKAYDANRFEYGGAPGLANRDADSFRDSAAGAQFRQGEQVNYQDANWDRMQSGQARVGQQQTADMMRARAMGLTPSIAQMQADRQMQQATAAQASAGASARGAAGLALAGQNAANNTATMQSSISNQAQINAAQERMQAEQSANAAYGNMRGGDFQAGSMAAGQAQAQAALNQQQRAQNDQYSMGMLGMEQNVRQQQMQGNLANQQLLANSYANQQSLNAGVNQNNANREMDTLKMGVGSVMGAAQMATPTPKADGGPISPGQPYLVGERGPEIIVPDQGGTVVPNHELGLAGRLGAKLGSYISPETKERIRQRIAAYAHQAEPQAIADRNDRFNEAHPTLSGLSRRMQGSEALPPPMDERDKELQRLREQIAVAQRAQEIVNQRGVQNDIASAYRGLVPLGNSPTEGALQVGDDGRAFYVSDAPTDDRASLAGPSAPAHLRSVTVEAPAPAPAPKPKPRKMTPEEIMAAANALGLRMESDHAARMGAGPAVQDPTPVQAPSTTPVEGLLSRPPTLEDRLQRANVERQLGLLARRAA